LKKNDRLCNLYCPINNCKSLLDWSIISSIADFTEEELSNYNSRLNENNLREQGYGICPWCNDAIQKPNSLSQNRVICDCGGPDFCWCCLQEWKSTGVQICYNQDCDLTKIAHMVENCPDKEADYDYLENKQETVMMPKLRACPNCLELIEHVAHCKHMTCPNGECELKFCFFLFRHF